MNEIASGNQTCQGDPMGNPPEMELSTDQQSSTHCDYVIVVEELLNQERLKEFSKTFCQFAQVFPSTSDLYPTKYTCENRFYTIVSHEAFISTLKKHDLA